MRSDLGCQLVDRRRDRGYPLGDAGCRLMLR
jgi:hypothetical protein